MITLPQIQKCSSIFISSPIRKATTFLGKISSDALESSPVRDTLIKQKPENAIFGETPLTMIKNIVSEDTLSMGKDAKVFSIPNHPNIVLRAEKTAIENIGQISEDIRLVPIQHSEHAMKQDNLGLPIYSVIDKSSPLYEREFISPAEALAQKDNIMVLKRVKGSHPMHKTYQAFRQLYGMKNGQANPFQQLNIQQFFYIKKNYGTEGARKCIEELKKGGNGTIPDGFFGEGSKSCTFFAPEVFVKNHENLTRTYLEELKQISELPQESYQKAVDTILMDKNFLVDFQHTNNTFVDVENKQFNFMDFEYDKTNAKYIYDNPIEEFKNVLLGKNFSSKLRSPKVFLTDIKDIAEYKKYSEQISEKVNNSAPERFKF